LITREEARLSQHKNLVTRALGVESTVEVEVNVHETIPGDLFLLCSDGLNDMVPDADIERTLGVAEDLAAAAQKLVQMANDNGGRDNVTVILARVLAVPVERGMMARLAGWMKQSA
jgi:protein phosphatase